MFNNNLNSDTKSKVNFDQTFDASPINILNITDPGDETQRNFRYQHAYGVILLAASVRGKKPYVALWCEHHEDFLGERFDGLFDGYQIKTRRPEIGEWTLQDEGFRTSIKRFIELDTKFPGKIAELFFVSNVDCLNTKASNKLSRSPFRLLEAIKNISSYNELTEPFNYTFMKLCQYCECDSSTLFAILKKLRLVKGPGRDSFDAEVAHDHLSLLPGCESHPPAVLNGIRDELIHLVFKASSLYISDPSRHWCCVNGEDHLNPKLRAKKKFVQDVIKIINEVSPVPFRYLPGSRHLNLNGAEKNIPILEKKMIKGGLVDQIDTMRRRSLSAERHLIELAYVKPDKIETILDQIDSVVKGECDEAFLSASLMGEPFGPKMLNDVFKRLRKITETRPEMVYNQPYECLVGVAGLLTGECSVWWSNKFDLEEAI